jgi:hypothetical protein
MPVWVRRRNTVMSSISKDKSTVLGASCLATIHILRALGGALITPMVLEYHFGSSDAADRLARSESPAARSGLRVKIGGVRCSLLLGWQASPCAHAHPLGGRHGSGP